MGESFVDRLRSSVPPPTGGPFVSAADVAMSLQQISVIDRFPTDYIELVSLYGPGRFDGFIRVLLPSSSNPHIDIAAQLTTRLGALTQLSCDPKLPVSLPISGAMGSSTEKIPYKITWPDPGIVPWAITENGDTVYWVASPLDSPDEWTVAVNEARGPDWQEFPMGASEFLYGVLSGTIAVRAFPADLPSAVPVFTAGLER